ncbi:MAG: cache domain-containing protein [Spirochaetales bacterium]|nr:cache domain-containing protein [Spirochaetales bacterium]
MNKKLHSSKAKRDISSILNRQNTTVLVISLFILMIASLLFIYISTANVMNKTLAQEVKTGAKRIEWVIQSYKNIAQGIGSIPELSNPKVSTTAKKLILENKTSEYGLVHCKTINLDGYSDMDSHYRGDRAYFGEAVKGNVTISDPIVSRSDNKVALVIGAPVWKNGIYNGTIDSVLFCSIDPTLLSNFLKDFSISKNSNIYVIGNYGKTVASLDLNKVLVYYSNIKRAYTNKEVKPIADFERQTLEGKKNQKYIFKDGTLHCFTSCKIAGTPNWALIIDSPVSDFLTTFWIALAFSVITSTTIIIVSRQLIRKHSKLISEPVKQMAERLRRAAIGDFKTDVNLENPIEEINTIAGAIHSLVSRMAQVLNGIYAECAKSDLKSFIDFKDYLSICTEFEKQFKVHLCFLDRNMQKITGTMDKDAGLSFSAEVLINGRYVGKYVASPEKDCLIDNEHLNVFVKLLAALVSKIFENIINREIHYKAREANERINNEKLIQVSQQMAKNLLAWTMQIKTNAGRNLNSLIEDFETAAKNYNMEVLESSEFSRFTNFNYTLKEADYNLTDLIENIKASAIKNSKNKIIFNMPEEKGGVLFGDRTAIEKVITRIILFLETKNAGCPIIVASGYRKNTYGCSLYFKFTVENFKFTDRDIKILHELEQKKKITIDPTNEYIKLLSAFNLLWLMDGSLKTLAEINYNLIVEIPQL